jgi:hypothetical protein
VFGRGDWVLCRDAISVEEFLQDGPRRRKLREWNIRKDNLSQLGCCGVDVPMGRFTVMEFDISTSVATLEAAHKKHIETL